MGGGGGMEPAFPGETVDDDDDDGAADEGPQAPF
jgi:hypothetical protein